MAARRSSLVSAKASTAPGRGLALAPWVRAAVQVGVAVGAATVVGDVISGRRFYWAVIAAFVSFIGVNNNLEQVRKAVLRVGGTVVGIVIGSLLAALDGPQRHGVHRRRARRRVLRRLPHPDQLRLHGHRRDRDGEPALRTARGVQPLPAPPPARGDRAVGAAIAAVTVLVVLPLRTQRVLLVALTSQLRSTRALLDEAIRQLAVPALALRAGALLGRRPRPLAPLSVGARRQRHC
jgi:hypothetical protein